MSARVLETRNEQDEREGPGLCVCRYRRRVHSQCNGQRQDHDHDRRRCFAVRRIGFQRVLKDPRRIAPGCEWQLSPGGRPCCEPVADAVVADQVVLELSR